MFRTSFHDGQSRLMTKERDWSATWSRSVDTCTLNWVAIRLLVVMACCRLVADWTRRLHWNLKSKYNNFTQGMSKKSSAIYRPFCSGLNVLISIAIRSAAYFTDGYSIIIQIQWQVSIVGYHMWLRNFAHVMTAQLSCHVRNFCIYQVIRIWMRTK